MPAKAPTVTPDRILQLAYAFREAKAVMSAVELDVFTALAERPLDLETLRSRIGIHERGARDFLDALVALGLLERDADGRYGNRPGTDLYLVRDRSTYVGGLLEYVNTREYPNWNLLTRALRTGEAQSGARAHGFYSALYAEEPVLKNFARAMSGGTLLVAQALAAKFPWQRCETLVDVGSAEGCLPVQIALTHSHISGGGFDLPAVRPAFESYVQEHGLGHRMRFYSGDFLKDPIPSADVLVLGRVLHNWDLATKKMLLGKVYAALPKGGSPSSSMSG